MQPDLQRRVQRYGWDKAVPFYERYWAAQLQPAQRQLLELADLGPGERVLDVAAGTGLVSFASAQQVAPGGLVLGTDISGQMVEEARATAVHRGLSNVRFERRDAEELDLGEERFDAALCALGLMYVPNPVRALREMGRWLRPGGRAVAAVWGARSNCGWAEIFPIVDARVRSEVCPMFFALGTGNALALTFTEAGFQSVTTVRLPTVLRYETADDACGAAFAGGPVALAYSRFDPATREAAHAEYLASIEPFRSGTGYDIPGEFVVVRGYISPSP